ncbi:hypothetical protein YC2023_124699 [Brassica napus]
MTELKIDFNETDYVTEAVRKQRRWKEEGEDRNVVPSPARHVAAKGTGCAEVEA